MANAFITRRVGNKSVISGILNGVSAVGYADYEAITIPELIGKKHFLIMEYGSNIEVDNGSSDKRFVALYYNRGTVYLNYTTYAYRNGEYDSRATFDDTTGRIVIGKANVEFNYQSSFIYWIFE